MRADLPGGALAGL